MSAPTDDRCLACGGHGVFGAGPEAVTCDDCDGTGTALICAACDQPIAGEPHTDTDGEDTHADCCQTCHPEREA